MKFVVYKTGRSVLPASDGDFSLAGFRSEGKTGERGWLDYLLIGLLTLSVHLYMVRHFHDADRNEPPVTPVKVPPMVQVTLIPPPLPKPIVQPPPPPPPPEPKKVEVKKPEPKKVEPPKPIKKEVVAIKPQVAKPKPPPRPVVRRVEPIEEPTPPEPEVEEAPAPVKAAPPRPPAPVAEKFSEPSASAGYLHNPTPTYPEIAEEEGWEGRVVLKVHVLANGRPDSVSVLKSSGHDVLDQAAIRTVKGSWHFAPAMRGSTPTDGWVSVPINFNLPG